MTPIVLLLGGIFLYTSLLMFDSDLGWSLRWGQYILDHGIRKTDVFSYTMPGYPFVDHEWIVHVTQYVLYQHGGPLALGIFFMIPLLLALRLVTRTASAPWKTIHLLLLGAALLQIFIPKPSLFTLLFVVVEMALLKTSWKWRRVALTVVFLLWANIHGGFLYGLGMYSLWEIGRMIETKTVRLGALLGIAAATLATAATPYGIHLWSGVLESVADVRLRTSVSEWQSSFAVIHLGTMFIVSIYATVLWYSKKTLRPTELVLLIITFIMGVTSRRNLPIWIVLAAPYVNEGIAHLEQTVRSVPGAAPRLRSAYVGLFFFVSLVFLYEVFFIVGQMRLRSESFYPQAAIAYLQQHPCDGRVFTPYEWGGYYLWKNPDKQVFIDGRMPSWRNPQARYPDSTDALSDTYQMMLGEKPIRHYVNRFHIGCFLLPTTLIYPAKPSSPDATRTESFRSQLQSQGKVVYKDSVAVVIHINETH